MLEQIMPLIDLKSNMDRFIVIVVRRKAFDE